MNLNSLAILTVFIYLFIYLYIYVYIKVSVTSKEKISYVDVLQISFTGYDKDFRSLGLTLPLNSGNFLLLTHLFFIRAFSGSTAGERDLSFFSYSHTRA